MPTSAPVARGVLTSVEAPVVSGNPSVDRDPDRDAGRLVAGRGRDRDPVARRRPDHRGRDRADADRSPRRCSASGSRRERRAPRRATRRRCRSRPRSVRSWSGADRARRAVPASAGRGHGWAAAVGHARHRSPRRTPRVVLHVAARRRPDRRRHRAHATTSMPSDVGRQVRCAVDLRTRELPRPEVTTARRRPRDHHRRAAGDHEGSPGVRGRLRADRRARGRATRRPGDGPDRDHEGRPCTSDGRARVVIDRAARQAAQGERRLRRHRCRSRPAHGSATTVRVR